MSKVKREFSQFEINPLRCWRLVKPSWSLKLKLIQISNSWKSRYRIFSSNKMKRMKINQKKSDRIYICFNASPNSRKSTWETPWSMHLITFENHASISIHIKLFFWIKIITKYRSEEKREVCGSLIQGRVRFMCVWLRSWSTYWRLVDFLSYILLHAWVFLNVLLLLLFLSIISTLIFMRHSHSRVSYYFTPLRLE